MGESERRVIHREILAKPGFNSKARQPVFPKGSACPPHALGKAERDPRDGL